MPESAASIRSTRDLRAFLLSAMEQVRSGELDVSKASAIAKLASHVNESLKAEVELRLQLLKINAENPELAGSLKDELDGIAARRIEAPRAQTNGVDHTSKIMGDPPPGRSALDQKRAVR